MKNWTDNGHPSELALEAWVASEAEAHELQTIGSHIQACPACRAQATEWRGLFLALSSLQGLEPSTSFDDRVMERVRPPTEAQPAVSAWAHRVALGAPRIAAAVIGAWTIGLVGAAAWLQNRVDVPPAVLLARFLGGVEELLVSAAIRVATFLHLSGFVGLWTSVTDTVPGVGLAVAVTLMAVMSGLAIWTLHRVIGSQTPRVDAHA